MGRISYQDVPASMFEKLREIEAYIEESSIPKQFLELLRLRISQLNTCAYCVDMHHKELKDLGETDLRLSMLCVWEEATLFSDKERAALKFAEVLSNCMHEKISEQVYTPLLSFFSKKEICYLTLSIAQITTWNQLMKTFQFESGNYQIERG